jgi:hypothetical protein
MMDLFRGDIVARHYGKAAVADAIAILATAPDTPNNSALAACRSTTSSCTNSDACPSQGVGCGPSRTGSCATEGCTPGVTMHPKCKDAN